VHANACTHESRQSPTAPSLPRDRKEEARFRCASRSGGDEPRSRVGIAKAQAFPAGAESERALLRAVLVDAIRCLAGEVSPVHGARPTRSESESWSHRWVAPRLFPADSRKNRIELDRDVGAF
jgi:hypothetical protein